jgi:hypothetical protein
VVNVTLNRIRAVRCIAKTLSVTYSVCMLVALDIQHSKRMRHIIRILSYVPCFILPYFSTLSLKLHDFRKNVIESKMYFSTSLNLFSETFLILRRIERDIIRNVCRSSCAVPTIIVRF